MDVRENKKTIYTQASDHTWYNEFEHYRYVCLKPVMEPYRELQVDGQVERHL